MDAAGEERLRTWAIEIVTTLIDDAKLRHEGDECRVLGQGGLSINTVTGEWYSHTAGKGGYSVIPLIMLLKGCSVAEACAWGDAWLKAHPGTGSGITGNDDDIAIKSAVIAQEILDKLVDPAGTPGETYSAETARNRK